MNLMLFSDQRSPSLGSAMSSSPSKPSLSISYTLTFSVKLGYAITRAKPVLQRSQTILGSFMDLGLLLCIHSIDGLFDSRQSLTPLQFWVRIRRISRGYPRCVRPSFALVGPSHVLRCGFSYRSTIRKDPPRNMR